MDFVVLGINVKIDVKNVVQRITHGFYHLHSYLMPLRNADLRRHNEVHIQQDVVSHAAAAKFVHVAHAVGLTGDVFQCFGIFRGKASIDASRSLKVDLNGLARPEKALYYWISRQYGAFFHEKEILPEGLAASS